ncbi:hypothetical protein SADUNF_Sadunf05G0090500 [Salix dunnii]|uniref:Phosphatidic acid phosphatase type 2/haloperoxidase domain-containing protein n=1 Tax=Salix dunnii TaxID=1413687 RepID=A0A835KAA6_9ROSI|nr:hypothetical protein SADUNF_Sadunf05G0090500 [Salix dunnii]
MMTITTILLKPTFKSLLHGPCMLNQAKPISFLQFPASKSDFSGSKNKAFSKTMTETVRISACRGSCGGSSEERTGCFQQGAVTDGRDKFQSVFAAVGLEATLNCLHDSVVQLLLEQSKWLVVTVFSAIILWRHDAKAMWAASGSVVNSILSVILKRLLNQERPDSALRSDPGMPSSHGQSIFFTVVFAILSVGEWFGVNDFTSIISGSILAFGTYLDQPYITTTVEVVLIAVGFTTTVRNSGLLEQMILSDASGVIEKKMHKLFSMMMKNITSAAINADRVLIDELLEEGMENLEDKVLTLLGFNEKDMTKPGETAKKHEVIRSF